MAKAKIKPTSDIVLLKPIEASDVTDAGIMLIAREPEQTTKGQVLALGPDCEEVEVKDIVIFPAHLAKEIEVDQKQYLLIVEGDILAKEMN